MKRDDKRFCDICEDAIPQGATFRRANGPSEMAALLINMARDSDDVPSLARNHDGTVSIDICMNCSSSMGTSSISFVETDD